MKVTVCAKREGTSEEATAAAWGWAGGVTMGSGRQGLWLWHRPQPQGHGGHGGRARRGA